MSRLMPIHPELGNQDVVRLDEHLVLIPPIDRKIGRIAVALRVKKHRKHDEPLRRPLRWSAETLGLCPSNPSIYTCQIPNMLRTFDTEVPDWDDNAVFRFT